MLKTVQPSVEKLRSLAAKGQVFKFDDYAKCQMAVVVLTQHFDRIVALMDVIGSPTWNWEHPEVLRLLKNIMAIDPKEIRNSIQENNVALLQFVRQAYKQIYGYGLQAAQHSRRDQISFPLSGLCVRLGIPSKRK